MLDNGFTLEEVAAGIDYVFSCWDILRRNRYTKAGTGLPTLALLASDPNLVGEGYLWSRATGVLKRFHRGEGVAREELAKARQDVSWLDETRIGPHGEPTTVRYADRYLDELDELEACRLADEAELDHAAEE